MMDDTSDCSNIEQSAASVRLINNGEIEEHLLGMIDSSDDQSADALTTILVDTLDKYKITPEKSKEKLIGKSYNGAPSMSGELSGVKLRIKFTSSDARTVRFELSCLFSLFIFLFCLYFV
eukprot:Seg9728.1 transcript_id=Seg9728.1/GoldUCD/mRNA.D3Y31 product="hypothetical protein" protein_id=Seg9728.1/GoldUCD/D3Y31